MYVFNQLTIKPRLPERIKELEKISNNLWWTWNKEFTQLFKEIDVDLWNNCEKNPVKFLKNVTQEKLEIAAENEEFLKKYDKMVNNFYGYINSKDTYFKKKYPQNTQDIIAYFSAEYGLDETIPIYSGGLGILSGDHMKSASDLGIPLVGIGLMYKEGYFKQIINSNGEQISEYNEIDYRNMPIFPALNENGEQVSVDVKIKGESVKIVAWELIVGRNKLYLLDTDIKDNNNEQREITKKLYGGGQEMRISQEIVLGIGGYRILKELGIKPQLYHMNEGHSAFLVIETIKDIMKEREVSFEVAKEIAFTKLCFTTHTPIPAGNDIFDTSLVAEYLKGKWVDIGLTKEEFLKMGMVPNDTINKRFNMAVLALKHSGKKNGVSKLHGKVSRELFSEVWPNTFDEESPIDYVTNGVHTCTWLCSQLKEEFNKTFPAYWQDSIHKKETWENIDFVPDEVLWDIHKKRKRSLQEEIRKNLKNRYIRQGMSYSEINEILKYLDPDTLTIGFARRFISYKRTALIFKDIERLTQILNDEKRPVQIVFAGKAHPADKAGQDIIRYIHELSMMPQFKGRVLLLEDYNMSISRYLISGVDVWLNNPRRPMEASGTSGEKAGINGVINFSVSDGWWEEGYNGKNGWMIGSAKKYMTYEEQDTADSNSIYDTLETQIIPKYYNKDESGIPRSWLKMMKESIKTIGAEYSTSRMLMEYAEKIYVPLMNLSKSEFENLENVFEYLNWKKEVYRDWKDIQIEQMENLNMETIEAGSEIDVKVRVKFNNINPENAFVQAYIVKVIDREKTKLEKIVDLEHSGKDEDWDIYSGKISIDEGGNFAYTFRVMPKHKMLLDSENLDIYKWLKN